MQLRRSLVKKELLDLNEFVGRGASVVMIAKYATILLLKLLVFPVIKVPPLFMLTQGLSFRNFIHSIFGKRPFEGVSSRVERLVDNFDGERDPTEDDLNSMIIEYEDRESNLRVIVEPSIERCKRLLTDFTSSVEEIMSPHIIELIKKNLEKIFYSRSCIR